VANDGRRAGQASVPGGGLVKIIVTADTHLRTNGECPERRSALLNILEYAKAEQIGTVIVAGDLFDNDCRNYAEFEGLCKDYLAVQVHVIPGNHDEEISGKNIIGDNIHIYTTPTVVEIGAVPFLFVPYQGKTSMVEKIVGAEDKIAGKGWILIAHGDYYGGVKAPNPLEPGTYMPLSRSNVERFKPRAVFLGHIHKGANSGSVYYVGSPCGLDISETGKRTFIEFDTSSGSVSWRSVVTDVIYFQESFVVVPADDEVDLLKAEISKRIASWGIDEADKARVRLRVEAVGYTRDRGAVFAALKEGFGGFSYYGGEDPNADRLSVSTDRQLGALAERAMKLIDDLKWDFGGDQPERDQLRIEALNVIYQV
jgi:exonuclease SbcD